MSITKERKQELAEKYGSDINDTGSVSVQISILTDRILYLTEHMKKHKKDFSSRRGLLTLVSKRRKLLTYLKTKKEKEYLELIAKLGLRR